MAIVQDFRDLEKQFENYQQEKGRAIVPEADKPVEQAPVVKTDQKEEDFGEEQFYLEPIE